MTRTPKDLIPIDVDQALQRAFRLNGTLEMVSGELGYEGQVQIQVDSGGLGELVKKAMLQRGRTAKAGPVTVRFVGTAEHRRRPAGGSR